MIPLVLGASTTTSRTSLGTPASGQRGVPGTEKRYLNCSVPANFPSTHVGWQGGAHATASLSTDCLVLEEDAHVGNKRLQLLQAQLSDSLEKISRHLFYQ